MTGVTLGWRARKGKDFTMNSDTTVTTPRDERPREEISYIAEGRVTRTQPAAGSLQCAWQTTDGALTCRWNWAELRGEDVAESDAVAA
jgi:hypothetical protein